MTPESPHTVRCLRCRRPIRSAEALATGYGSGCRAKIRVAAKVVADLSAWTLRQADQARGLIEDGGIVPTSKSAVFRTVATAGDAIYLTTANGCTCPASKACYHRCAVVIVTTSLTSPEPARASLAVAA